MKFNLVRLVLPVASRLQLSAVGAIPHNPEAFDSAANPDRTCSLHTEEEHQCVEERLSRASSRLRAAKYALLEVLSDGNLVHPNICGHADVMVTIRNRDAMKMVIGNLRVRFFDLLRRSKLYGTIGSRDETLILAMGPDDFMENCSYDGMYAHLRSKTSRYEKKLRDYTATRQRLELQRRETENMEPHDTRELRLILIELDACSRMLEIYRNKLAVQAEMKSCYREIKLLSHKMLGEHTVEKLYKSYANALSRRNLLHMELKLCRGEAGPHQDQNNGQIFI